MQTLTDAQAEKLDAMRIARDTAVDGGDELAAAKAQLAIYDAYIGLLAKSPDWDGRICSDRLPDGGYVQDLMVSLEVALRHLISSIDRS